MKTKYAVGTILLIVSLNLKADYWTQKASFPSSGRCVAFSFVIGNKGYVGGGRGAPIQFHKDFWQYDPVANIWTQLPDLPGAPRMAASSFAIGNKGYVGLGMDTSYLGTNDFYEFDPSTNTWTQKASFSGTSRFAASSFSIDSLGFIGIGLTTTQFNFILHNDLWAYDPVTDTWTQKASLPAVGRSNATSFSIGSKGYIVAGVDSFNYLKELWEYDAVTDMWTQKQSLPSWAVGRADLASFSLGSNGYICTGQTGVSIFTKECFTFNPGLNQWVQVTDFPGNPRDETVGFSIGSHGYVGLGGHNSIPAYTNFWEYAPDHPNAIDTPEHEKNEYTITPNPSDGMFTISGTIAEKYGQLFTCSGLYMQKIFFTQASSQKVFLPTISNGIYYLKIGNDIKKVFIQK